MTTRGMLRQSTSAAIAIALAIPAAAYAQAESGGMNIPAQDLASALRTLAQTSHQQISFSGDAVRGLRSAPVKGNLPFDTALNHMLKGTKLQAHMAARGVYVVGPLDRPAEVAERDSDRSADIIVTAQKKEELLRRTPVPVSVLNTDSLADNGKTLAQDYFSSIPGLSFAPVFEGRQSFVVRGLGGGGGQSPLVGVTVDDVPYLSALADFGDFTPELDVSDMDRIEVLRGPQGTLYGADAMAGLVRFVTKAPSFDGFSGRVQFGANSVANGDEPGYDLRGSINAPVSTTFAVRASAYVRQDAGYIDNPRLDLKGANQGQAEGARLTGLWQPTPDLSIKLNAMYQHRKFDGESDVDLSLGDLKRSFIAGLGSSRQSFQSYAATVNWKLGAVNLTSVSGYNAFKSSVPYDYTWGLGSFTANGISGSDFNGFGAGIDGTPLITDPHVRRFSQELRANGTLWDHLDWLVGGFYTHENDRTDQYLLGLDPNSGKLYGQTLDLYSHVFFSEYAAFVDLTYHFSDKFDVQVGGRETHLSTTTHSGATGPFALLIVQQVPPYVAPIQRAKANSFTYLFTPRYKISPDAMIYARLASGFRPGNTNPPIAGVASEAEPDKMQTYEVGVKAELPDQSFSIDASLFDIEWKNIQLQITDFRTALGYTTNGGGARSRGAEISATLKPWHGLTLNGWIDFTDAVLTKDLVKNAPGDAFGLKGDRLPSGSRWSGYLSAQQNFPLGAGVTGFVGADASFVGSRYQTFTTTAARQILPAYTQLDLRAGARFGSWNVNLYANNVTDKRGLLTGGVGSIEATAFNIITPRKIGFNIAKTF
jgi:iron complex outermembrane recepter protein